MHSGPHLPLLAYQAKEEALQAVALLQKSGHTLTAHTYAKLLKLAAASGDATLMAAIRATCSPQPRSWSRLIPSTDAFLGTGFHNFSVLCAKCTHLLAYFSPKISDSVLSLIRG